MIIVTVHCFKSVPHVHQTHAVVLSMGQAHNDTILIVADVIHNGNAS